MLASSGKEFNAEVMDMYDGYRFGHIDLYHPWSIMNYAQTGVLQKVYMDPYKPAYAIKLSVKNFAFEDNKKIVLLSTHKCTKVIL